MALDGFFYENNIPDTELIELVEDQTSLAVFVEGTDSPIQSFNNPYHIKCEIMKFISNENNVEEIRKIKNGNYIVVTKNKNEAKNILKISKLNNKDVKTRISLDSILYNYIIRDVDESIPLDIIAKELAIQNMHVKRIIRFSKKIESAVIPLKLIKITTIGKQTQNKIKICYEIKNLTTFINRPRICKNCCKFNHIAKNCRSQTKCLICSDHHTSETCTSQIVKCPNCNGEHRGDNKECELYLKESLILSTQAEMNLTYIDAKTFIQKKSNNETYAKKTKSIEDPKVKELSSRVEAMEKSISSLASSVSNIATTIKTSYDQLSNQMTQLTSMLVNTMSQISSVFEKMSMYSLASNKNQNPRKRKTSYSSSQFTSTSRVADRNPIHIKHGNMSLFESEEDSIDIDDHQSINNPKDHESVNPIKTI